MKSLLDRIIDRLRSLTKPTTATWVLSKKDGSVSLQQGLNKITLSHSDFLLLRQLKEWQS